MSDQGHFILSREINTGKSSELMQYVVCQINRGLKVSGWISPPFIKDNLKCGYDVVFFVLSRQLNAQRLIREIPFDRASRWRRFYLDRSVFYQARTLDFGTPDLFIIDEVGPLELVDHEGFWPALADIYKKQRRTVTVVRRSSVTGFKREFGTISFAPFSCWER
ncbi:MAG: hypothetical protein HQM16_10885 [Deltaproteobacteria bacterium]|nr:hypothetical protein [Deltaproteobacteria bacterium]